MSALARAIAGITNLLMLQAKNAGLQVSIVMCCAETLPNGFEGLEYLGETRSTTGDNLVAYRLTKDVKIIVEQKGVGHGSSSKIG